MDTSLFSQAVDEMFPKLDEAARTEIKNSVFEHMIATMREKVFAHDAEGKLKVLASMDEKDPIKNGELYLKQIFEKFDSLSAEEKLRINKELDEELTRVMNEIYKAYE